VVRFYFLCIGDDYGTNLKAMTKMATEIGQMLMVKKVKPVNGSGG